MLHPPAPSPIPATGNKSAKTLAAQATAEPGRALEPQGVAFASRSQLACMRPSGGARSTVVLLSPPRPAPSIPADRVPLAWTRTRLTPPYLWARSICGPPSRRRSSSMTRETNVATEREFGPHSPGQHPHLDTHAFILSGVTQIKGSHFIRPPRSVVR